MSIMWSMIGERSYLLRWCGFLMLCGECLSFHFWLVLLRVGLVRIKMSHFSWEMSWICRYTVLIENPFVYVTIYGLMDCLAMRHEDKQVCVWSWGAINGKLKWQIWYERFSNGDGGERELDTELNLMSIYREKNILQVHHVLTPNIFHDHMYHLKPTRRVGASVSIQPIHSSKMPRRNWRHNQWSFDRTR